MYCSKCQKTLSGDAVFCDNCGTRLESDPAPIVQTDSVQVNGDSGTQTGSVNNSSPVNQASPANQASAMNQTGSANQSNYNQQAPNNNYKPSPAYAPPPPPYTAQPYAPPPAPEYHMTTGRWIGIFLINLVPFVGPLVYLILLFVWAFGTCKYPSLKSFAKAMLIFMLIGIIVAIVFAVVLAPMINEVIGEFGPELFEYW